MNRRDSDLTPDLQRLAEAVRFPMEAAPRSAVEAAKGIFEGKPVSALRLGLSFGFAGARSAAASERIQASFDAGEFQVRVMVDREGEAYRVLGRTEPNLGLEWVALVGDVTCTIGASGEFSCLVASVPEDILILGPKRPILLSLED